MNITFINPGVVNNYQFLKEKYITVERATNPTIPMKSF